MAKQKNQRRLNPKLKVVPAKVKRPSERAATVRKAARKVKARTSINFVRSIRG